MGNEDGGVAAYRRGQDSIMGIRSRPLKDKREGGRTLFLQSDIAKQEEKQSIYANIINSPNCIKPGVQRVGFGGFFL